MWSWVQPLLLLFISICGLLAGIVAFFAALANFSTSIVEFLKEVRSLRKDPPAAPPPGDTPGSSPDKIHQSTGVTKEARPTFIMMLIRRPRYAIIRSRAQHDDTSSVDEDKSPGPDD